MRTRSSEQEDTLLRLIQQMAAAFFNGFQCVKLFFIQIAVGFELQRLRKTKDSGERSA